jgi:hypothetical protein
LFLDKKLILGKPSKYGSIWWSGFPYIVNLKISIHWDNHPF